MQTTSRMLYNIHDKLPPKRLIVAALQQVVACFVATVLIPQICGVPIAPAMVGAGIGTLIYMFFTHGRSPMFISSSGAFVAAVIGALALGTAPNFTAVALGGMMVAIVYGIVGMALARYGTGWLQKYLPPVVIGPVVAVIGLNLATFLPTYFQMNGQYSLLGMALGGLTLVITALLSHYGKGFVRNLPFLVSMLIVYGIASVLTLCGIPIIDFSVFQGVHLFQLPDFSFFHINFATFDWKLIPQIAMLFVPISIVGISEHMSDHKALSAVIGTDLTEDPGLGLTLIGDGVASAIGCYLCGLPNTSYGESVGTTGFSKICSKYVMALAAGIMALAGFIGPLQAFLVSIPSAIFGGCAAILYGYIALSEFLNKSINTNSGTFDNDNKNAIILSTVLTLGVGGVVLNFGIISFGTTALALIIGVIMNLILKGKTSNGWEQI